MRQQRYRLLVAGMVIAGIGGELASRHILGLGDPPLLNIDPEIEYIYKPNSSYSRFGNLISYNEISMRSDPPPGPETPAIKRLLVLGDSVVNGGSLIDQSDLATQRLSQELGNRYWVGNISAGSWGPANLLAYIKRYGWQKADAAALVVSTHDLMDLPTFKSDYGPNFPTQRPSLALTELANRYAPRLLPLLNKTTPAKASKTLSTSEQKQRLERGKASFKKLVEQMRNNVPISFVILHPTTEEMGRPPSNQRQQLKSIAEAEGMTVIDLLSEPQWNAGLYRDNIHLKAKGQDRLAKLLLRQLTSVGALNKTD